MGYLRIEILGCQALPVKPAAQVGNQSNLIACRLPCITLTLQQRRMRINVSAQRAIVHALNRLGSGEKEMGQVSCLEARFQEKTPDYAEYTNPKMARDKERTLLLGIIRNSA